MHACQRMSMQYIKYTLSKLYDLHCSGPACPQCSEGPPSPKSIFIEWRGYVSGAAVRLGGL